MMTMTTSQEPTEPSMVRAEGLPLASARPDDQLRKRQVRWGMMMAVAALAIAGCVLAAQTVGAPEGEVELFPAKRQLTPEEKKFVQGTVSTPDVDLEKAKFASKDGNHDMNSFFDSMGDQLKEKDAKAHSHLAQLKKHASTTAAKRDITKYFDTMRASVEELNAAEHAKQKGTGKASLSDINSYFDGLSIQQQKINKADEQRLAGVKPQRHTASAAPQNPLAPVQGVMPPHAESTEQAESDMDSYFDSMQSVQSKINNADVTKLAGGKAGAKSDHRLSAAQSQADMDSYFDHVKSKVASKDSGDVERLRKDASPANADNGVRVAVEEERNHKIAQLKVVHAQKRVIARRQARGRQHMASP